MVVICVSPSTIDSRTIAYQAVAGTLVIHPKDWDDVPRDPNTEKPSPGATEDGGDAKNPTAAKTAEHLHRIERHVGAADGVITALSNFAKLPLPRGPGVFHLAEHLPVVALRHATAVGDVRQPRPPPLPVPSAGVYDPATGRW